MEAMPASAVTPYDEVPYPGQVHAQTHPERLSVIAALRGLVPAPPERCRVLELGCGDGTNLLSMAQHAPGSEFVGVDLAPTSVEEGRRIAAALGWSHVKLRVGDIAQVGDELGTFDYVVAHGVYSWVPAPVRDALLAVAGACLRPNGVAFVSYVVYPGAHLGQMLREMMLLHVRGVTDPRERIARSIEFLRFLASTRDERDPWRLTVTRELERALERRGAVLRHDELGDVREPVWFHEFAAHAARHGLAFLAEADWHESSELSVGPESRKLISGLSGDPVAREQYLDFAKCRRFRQTLLCRAGTALSPVPRVEVVRASYVSAHVSSDPKSPGGAADLSRTEVERFTTPTGGAVQTDAPAVRAALRTLGAAWPRRIGFDDLVARSGSALEGSGAAPIPRTDLADTLADALFRLFETGVVRLHGHDAPCAAAPGDRPRAGDLARVQARSRDVVTSLLHENVHLADETARGLVGLLDGASDRGALLTRLREHTRRFSAPGGGPPPPDAAHLETALRELVGVGLLSA